MTAELIDAGHKLRAIGRAGVGVDNVDVDGRHQARDRRRQRAAVQRGDRRRAHDGAAARARAQRPAGPHVADSGKWERSKFSGVELYEKTLGILGFGRIGQLVAQRARGFGMRVLAFDPFVSAERYRELGVEKAAQQRGGLRAGGLHHVHLPKTPETEGWLDAEAFAKMRDGVRILNVARGGLVDDEALKAALDSGKVGGAALDVFPSEPMTELPAVLRLSQRGRHAAPGRLDRGGHRPRRLSERRAGRGRARPAASCPPPSTSRRSPPRTWRCSGRSCRWPRQLGRLAMELAEGSSVERIEAAFMGRIADFDTRLLTVAVLNGALQGRTEEQVNLVNAPAMAEERGIVVEEKAVSEAQDFNELIRVTVVAGGERVAVAGTGIGPERVPHLVEVQGRRLTVELEQYVTVFRYADLPGMIGRVGTIFGATASTSPPPRSGTRPDGATAGDAVGRTRLAAMVVTTDAPVPDGVVRGDRRLGRVRRRLDGRARLGPRGRRLRRLAVGCAPDARWSSRSTGGPEVCCKVRGAARPGARPGRGAHRSGRGGDELRRHHGAHRPVPDAPKPPVVVGYEVAGTILELGDGVDGLTPGQRVMAGTQFGGYASQVVVPGDDVVAMPEGLTFEQGAAVPVNYSTAWAGLIGYGSLQPGERVLIHAAGGGVGIAATQIAKRTAPRSTARPRPPSTSASASSGSTTRSTTPTTDGRSICRSFDIVLDAIGGKSFRTSYSCCVPAGASSPSAPPRWSPGSGATSSRRCERCCACRAST